jgi:8-oxo-dGTP diphosphatase
MSENEINQLLTPEILKNYRVICEGFIFNEKGQIFAQKRSATRLKHPNSWNLVGGHLDEGETLTECIKREIYEETGWEVESIAGLIDTFYFTMPASMLKESEKAKEIVFKFLIKIKELKEPVLETGKVSEYRWFDRTNADVTLENRTEEQGKTYIKDSILQALDYIATHKISYSGNDETSTNLS